MVDIVSAEDFEVTPESVTELVEATLAEDSAFGDVFVVDVVVRGHSGTRVVEVFLDGDVGLTIDRISQMSRRLRTDARFQRMMDDGRIEVSSPGPKRSLLLPRQYRKHIGRALSLTLANSQGKKKGVLKSVTDAAILIEVGAELVTIEFNQIVEGKVALPW